MNQLAIVGCDAEIGVVDSDVECTPPAVFQPVLRAARRAAFDFDPATHPDALVPARLRIFPPRDGLTLPWPERGLGWLNPPYSGPWPWLERAAYWCASSHGRTSPRAIVGLVKLDPTTSWWRAWIDGCAEGYVVLADRVRHVKPGRDRNFAAPFPQAIVVWSNWKIGRRLVRQLGHDGRSCPSGKLGRAVLL